MNNIIPWEDARDLINKLLAEHIPLHAMLISPTGTRTVLRGFVDSATVEHGLCISAGRPPSAGPGFIAVPIANRNYEFAYGEKRELPKDVQQQLDPKYGDAVLTIRFLDDGEYLALIFSP